ncbi:MAG TPA: amidohydrolase family protein [Thermoanaerobaculia bacterium]|jgi:imidazolonepropionase-like amidohydrolase|nr:amidohydrolase family protein [Thermoanaerobaculia bacterium]
MLKRLLLLLLLTLPLVAAEVVPAYAPDRRPGEGDGPFKRLIIRGATVIDGSGAPPIGPMDVVIEGNKIVEVRSVGYPKVPVDASRRPADATKEIDGSKMYVLPGFIDMHGHAGGVQQGTTAEYVFKLWLAHGVTTVREPGSGNGLEWTIHERDRSAKNEIAAPRIVPYVFTVADMWKGGAIDSPEQARKFVQWVAKNGGAGLKVIGGGDPVYDPDILAALIDEAKKQKLGTTTHLSQMGVARMNILQAARLGLDCMEHWYGLPESLFADRTIQDYPSGYNYLDEQHRFGEAGRLWRQAAPPGSEKWNAVMNELLGRGFTLDPTLTIYEASRDLMRAMRAEWHDRYTLPSLWKWYEPSRKAHGSYWFDWTTRDEVEWKNNYRLWMAFLNEYKNRGGRVTTGSDSGYIYKLYGFDYIRELELLQEAGFHPLEVIRAATFHGAEALAQPTGKKPQVGMVRAGMLADLVLVEENPLANLKVLYGTGAIRVNDETGKVERTAGVKYVIKDGIVYDAKQLLGDVERIVSDAKKGKP